MKKYSIVYILISSLLPIAEGPVVTSETGAFAALGGVARLECHVQAAPQPTFR